MTQAELEDVFDDPQDGDPGMDRMAVHLVLEIVLLLAVVGFAVFFRQTHPSGIAGANLRTTLLAAAALGFVAMGLGLSVRAGAVNLAVGPIAAGAALFFAGHAHRGTLPTAGVILLLAAGLGAAMGVLVVGLHVPAWAVTVAGAFAAIVWIQKHTTDAVVNAGYDPTRHAYYWYGGFVGLAVIGGLLGLIRPVRRAVGRFRPVGDPAARRGAVAGTVAFLAIVVSSMLAGLGGMLTALGSQSVTPTDGMVTTGLALGAVLAGGTSAFGRRGGVLGTALGVTLLVLIMRYNDVAHLRIAPFALAASAIVVGLVVTRVVEAFGKPRAAGVTEAEPWRGDESEPSGASSLDTGTGAWSTRPGGWASQLPARATDDTWAGAADDRWRTGR